MSLGKISLRKGHDSPNGFNPATSWTKKVIQTFLKIFQAAENPKDLIVLSLVSV